MLDCWIDLLGTQARQTEIVQCGRVRGGAVTAVSLDEIQSLLKSIQCFGKPATNGIESSQVLKEWKQVVTRRVSGLHSFPPLRQIQPLSFGRLTRFQVDSRQPVD